MAAAKRDMFFLQFKPREDDRFFPHREEAESRAAFLRQTAWFTSNGLTLEGAQPRGLIEGYGGLYAVWFDGPDDPRVAAYSALFEDADGISLEPDFYQLYFMRYEEWLKTPRLPDDNL